MSSINTEGLGFSFDDSGLAVIAIMFACGVLCLIGSMCNGGSTGQKPETPSVDRKVDESMKNEEWFSRYKRAYENENFEKAGRIFCRNNPGAC